MKKVLPAVVFVALVVLAGLILGQSTTALLVALLVVAIGAVLSVPVWRQRRIQSRMTRLGEFREVLTAPSDDASRDSPVSVFGELLEIELRRISTLIGESEGTPRRARTVDPALRLGTTPGKITSPGVHLRFASGAAGLRDLSVIGSVSVATVSVPLGGLLSVLFPITVPTLHGSILNSGRG